MFVTGKSERSFLIDTNGKSFETPFFVPAISSIKANWNVTDYVNLVEKIGYNSFLISAYDIFKYVNKTALAKSIAKIESRQIVFFLDNGNYEAFWYRDNTWTLGNLKEVLDFLSPDFCFSFDVFWDSKAEIGSHIKETITHIAKTAGFQKSGTTIALIHSAPEGFPKIAGKIVSNIYPEIIAVPERELGSGILERCQTIKRIRHELDKIHRSTIIHVLGAGNPISLLTYTLSGADTYDALDWSNFFINPKSGQFAHFSQRDLFDCDCEACKMKSLQYDYAVMTHNLLFYQRFMDQVRNAIQDNEVEALLNEYLQNETISKVKRRIELK